MSKLSKNQGCAWKFNHKTKSSKGKIPSQRYTIVLDHCHHDSFSGYKRGDEPFPKKPDFDVLDECNDFENRNKISNYPEDYNEKSYHGHIDTDFPQECAHCTPRSGELVINGGFEHRSDPLFSWVMKSGAEVSNPDIGEIAHEGVNAVKLGSSHHYAILYQDVPGICPGMFYQLNFYLSAATEYSNAAVNVWLEFLDHQKNKIDHPALKLSIPSDSLSSIAFTGFNNSTRTAAPPYARFARISFEIDTHYHPERHVHLDDVSLIAIWNPLHGSQML